MFTIFSETLGIARASLKPKRTLIGHAILDSTMKDLDWSFIQMDLKNHKKFRFEILVIQLLSKV